ncbi:uncharacterized protein LOC129594021 [Paramacrobiotus metropolitanus]|uniref:uncharacterized protein LOC129594021 n=1 Tax=Paramacrobiotus metropolitanus TaxID=2943436 RepID=UPI0024459B8A|nr:uncharacterized protein LOC129594021 [Paramacrobiotus metropolitanus]
MPKPLAEGPKRRTGPTGQLANSKSRGGPDRAPPPPHRTCCILRRGGSSVTTVDVVDVDGELLSGSVFQTCRCCCMGEGIYIDFDCGSKCHGPFIHRIPFDRIYLRQNWNLLQAKGQTGQLHARSIDQKEEFAAEVEISLEREEPWKRYPATLLMGDFAMCSFGLARITMPNGIITTVVRGKYIHAPFDRRLATLAKDGDFYTATLKGNQTCCSEKCRKRKLKRKIIEDHLGRGKRLKTEDTMPRESGFCMLPIALSREIFEYLNTAQQCRNRNVCHKWNDILTSPLLSNRTSLEYGYLSVEEAAEEEYLNAASICHRWSKLITITNCPHAVHFKHKLPTMNAGVFQRIIQEKGYQPAQKVIIHNQQWNVCSGRFQESVIAEFIIDLHAELTAFASVCKALVIRSLTVNLLSVGKSRQFQVVIVRGNIGTDRPLSLNDFWDLIDDSFPPPTDDDLKAVATWIQETVQRENVSRYRSIMQALMKVQVPDPRDGNQYSHVLFPAPTETNFDFLSRLNVKKLTRFTVHALLSELRFRRLTLTSELSW